jgi:hypothetical protein
MGCCANAGILIAAATATLRDFDKNRIGVPLFVFDCLLDYLFYSMPPTLAVFFRDVPKQPSILPT